jgi:archaellum component FlaC
MQEEPEKLYEFSTKSLNTSDPTEALLIVPNHSDSAYIMDLYKQFPLNGYEIKNVFYVNYPPQEAHLFNATYRRLEKRAEQEFFAPGWREEYKDSLENLSACEEAYKAVKGTVVSKNHLNYVDGWHGTSYESLSSLLKTGPANLATTDAGFFGKGIYLTDNPEYALRVYSKENDENKQRIVLLMRGVCYSFYPVIATPNWEDKFVNKANYSNYDAHAIPVIPYNPHNINETNYFPAYPLTSKNKAIQQKKGRPWEYIEWVYFNPAQTRIMAVLVVANAHFIKNPASKEVQSVLKNYKAAKRSFEEAAKLGYLAGWIGVVQTIKAENPENPQIKGKIYYLMAQDNPRAAYLLGLHYLSEGNAEEGRKFLEAAANKNDIRAGYELAKNFPDEKNKEKYLSIAFKAGIQESGFLLSDLHEKNNDLKKALKYAEQMAKCNNENIKSAAQKRVETIQKRIEYQELQEKLKAAEKRAEKAESDLQKTTKSLEDTIRKLETTEKKLNEVFPWIQEAKEKLALLNKSSVEKKDFLSEEILTCLLAIELSKACSENDKELILALSVSPLPIFVKKNLDGYTAFAMLTMANDRKPDKELLKRIFENVPEPSLIINLLQGPPGLQGSPLHFLCQKGQEWDNAQNILEVYLQYGGDPRLSRESDDLDSFAICAFKNNTALLKKLLYFTYKDFLIDQADLGLAYKAARQCKNVEVETLLDAYCKEKQLSIPLRDQEEQKFTYNTMTQALNFFEKEKKLEIAYILDKITGQPRGSWKVHSTQNKMWTEFEGERASETCLDIYNHLSKSLKAYSSITYGTSKITGNPAIIIKNPVEENIKKIVPITAKEIKQKNIVSLKV